MFQKPITLHLINNMIGMHTLFHSDGAASRQEQLEAYVVLQRLGKYRIALCKCLVGTSGHILMTANTGLCLSAKLFVMHPVT